MDPILLQKQVRDNAEDLQGFLLDLKNWQADMKRKDAELRDTSLGNQSLPPCRNKVKRVKQEKKSETVNVKKNKISSYDYSSWDKFDVDKACEEVDLVKPNEESDDSSEQVEFDDNQERLREEAVYEKEMGNEYVKRQKWKDAMICYNRAIKCYPYDAIFYANRALCYLNTKDPKSAEADCTSSLQLDASYVKAYQRRAAARSDMGQLEEAKSDLLKVLELEPQNSASRTKLTNLEKKINTNKKHVTKQNKSLSCSSAQGMLLGQDGKCLETGSSGDSASIPESWSHDGKGKLKLVKPIYKPPHMRSKMPLKRIHIQELGDEAEYKGIEDSKPKEHSEKHKDVSGSTECNEKSQESVVKLEETLKKQDLTECQPKNEYPINSVEMVKKSCSDNLEQHTSIEQQIPPLPKSSVQFVAGWKNVKNNPRLRLLYLKQVPGKELPQIFRDSLESKMFSDLLSVLKADFLPSREAVYQYLLGLSNVRRFATLTMFLTKTEKTGIKELLAHCVKSGECSQEEALLLEKKYEIP